MPIHNLFLPAGIPGHPCIPTVAAACPTPARVGIFLNFLLWVFSEKALFAAGVAAKNGLLYANFKEHRVRSAANSF